MPSDGCGRNGTSGTELVIFDCDGVLVDSEPIAIAVLVDLVRGSGVAISSEDAYGRFLGRSMATISDMLGREMGLAIGARELDAMRHALYARFRSELKPVEGIGEALERLAMRCCVASSSQPERIALSLDLTGLFDQFAPNIFSATMVPNGKPAPDLFLHAASSMGVARERCVVIEDSPAGIEAAKRAGMRVFAFVGASHAPIISLRDKAAALEPDLIFDNMRDLPALLEAQAW